MIVSTTDVTLPKSLDSIEWEVREDGDRAREDCQSASLKRNQLSGERSVTKWDLDGLCQISLHFRFTGDTKTEARRHAWSDNDLFGQKWTNQDLSENTFELELSSSCQNLSNDIIPTNKYSKGIFYWRYSRLMDQCDNLH